MSMQDDLVEGIRILIDARGEDVIQPDGTPKRGLVTSPQLSSEFGPGAEMLEESIRVRFDCPNEWELQTRWKIRGEKFKLLRVEGHPSAPLLIFES